MVGRGGGMSIIHIHCRVLGVMIEICIYVCLDPQLSLEFIECMYFFFLSGVSQIEALIAISSVTSSLLFSASGFLSCSVISFIEIFLHDVPAAKVSSMN